MGRKFNAGKASVDALRSEGWAADLVERRNKFGSLDFLGFGDVVALKGGIPLVVQATMEGKCKERLDKMRPLPGLRLWLEQGGLVAIWGWGKVKRVRGGTAFKWEPKRKISVTLDDLRVEIQVEVAS